MPVEHMEFAINKGYLITSSGSTLYRANFTTSPPTIEHKYTIPNGHGITALHLPVEAEWMYLGTSKGNIIPFNVEKWLASKDIIYWNDCSIQTKHAAPGYVVSISEKPSDHSKLLIGHNLGSICLYNTHVKKSIATWGMPDQEPLCGLCWHPQQDKFMSAHCTGMTAIWSLEKTQPESAKRDYSQRPSSPTIMDPVTKIVWALAGHEALVIHSGGNIQLPTLSALTVAVGNNKKSLVFDSPVVDFVLLSPSPWHQDAYPPRGMAVLTEKQILFYDLLVPEMPQISPGEPGPTQPSDITCVEQYSSIPTTFITALMRLGQKQVKDQNTSVQWPLLGGVAPPKSQPVVSDLLVLGYAEGAISFLDVTEDKPIPLYCLEISDSCKTVGVPLPDKLNVTHIDLCVTSRTLSVACLSGEVFLFAFSLEGKEVTSTTYTPLLKGVANQPSDDPMDPMTNTIDSHSDRPASLIGSPMGTPTSTTPHLVVSPFSPTPAVGSNSRGSFKTGAKKMMDTLKKRLEAEEGEKKEEKNINTTNEVATGTNNTPIEPESDHFAEDSQKKKKRSSVVLGVFKFLGAKDSHGGRPVSANVDSSYGRGSSFSGRRSSTRSIDRSKLPPRPPPYAGPFHSDATPSIPPYNDPIKLDPSDSVTQSGTGEQPIKNEQDKKCMQSTVEPLLISDDDQQTTLLDTTAVATESAQPVEIDQTPTKSQSDVEKDDSNPSPSIIIEGNHDRPQSGQSLSDSIHNQPIQTGPSGTNFQSGKSSRVCSSEQPIQTEEESNLQSEVTKATLMPTDPVVTGSSRSNSPAPVRKTDDVATTEEKEPESEPLPAVASEALDKDYELCSLGSLDSSPAVCSTKYAALPGFQMTVCCYSVRVKGKKGFQPIKAMARNSAWSFLAMCVDGGIVLIDYENQLVLLEEPFGLNDGIQECPTSVEFTLLHDADNSTESRPLPSMVIGTSKGMLLTYAVVPYTDPLLLRKIGHNSSSILGTLHLNPTGAVFLPPTGHWSSEEDQLDESPTGEENDEAEPASLELVVSVSLASICVTSTQTNSRISYYSMDQPTTFVYFAPFVVDGITMIGCVDTACQVHVFTLPRLQYVITIPMDELGCKHIKITKAGRVFGLAEQGSLIRATLIAKDNCVLEQVKANSEERHHNKTEQARKRTDGIAGKMHENKQLLAERGQKMEEIDEKTAGLADSAKQFSSRIKEYNKKM
eukprot:Ihof_evm21s13 gene=Ihof_evmTU21s13